MRIAGPFPNRQRIFKLEFIEENGLPHQCAHWFAMTVIFDTFRTIFA